MSRGDWLKFAKAVGLGAGAIGVVLLIYFAGYGMGSSGGYFDAQANGYAAQYPADTDQRVDRCFREGLPPRDTQTCISEAIKASHEDQRTEQDLSAQRKSAEWARWIFIITLAQLPLTGLGLIFLLRTIHQGQDALGLARQDHRAQFRPYVHLAKVRLGEHETYGPYVRATIINQGTVNARNVQVNIAHQFFMLPLPAQRPELVPDVTPFPSLRPRGKGHANRPYYLSDEQIAAIENLGAVLWYAAEISYRPHADAEPEVSFNEYVFFGPDLKAGRPRLIDEWMYKEPPADEDGQEDLGLSPPSETQTPETGPEA